MFTSTTDEFVIDAHYEALVKWRDAENLVRDRWETFLHAERAGRRLMFASYVAALDAEEAAAHEFAECSVSRAA